MKCTDSIFLQIEVQAAFFFLLLCMNSTIINTIQASAFLILGLMLLFVQPPDWSQLKTYKMSKKIFGCAYLLIVVVGMSGAFTAKDAGRHFAYVYFQSGISLVHAWLNGYAYLLMLTPSEASRRIFLNYAKWGLPSILLTGAATLFFPACYPAMNYILGAIYICQITCTCAIIYKEYRISIRALDNFYDGTIDSRWMWTAINLTLVLAFINLLNFYIPNLEIILSITNVAFYTYFAIHLLNYVPMYIYMKEARKEVTTEKGAVVDDDKDKATVNHIEKIQPLLQKWTESYQYCQSSLTLTNVAEQMGTNQCYLSIYLNKIQGVSFQVWLNALRIERSKALLLEHPDKSIEEIGSMVGIPRLYNYSRWFKQISGTTPLQWRKNEKQ